jgi:hypothetical protein
MTSKKSVIPRHARLAFIKSVILKPVRLAGRVEGPCSCLLTLLFFCTFLTAQTGVFTYHNDVNRTGENSHETTLTPANVDATHFGKLFSHVVDGDVYAQPLYAPNVAIPGKGAHNIVFVATQGDSLYAFDADVDAEPLWRVSLIDPAHGASSRATVVKVSEELACFAILPQVGITSTPVVDPDQGTIYVETFSKESGVFVHRLHAIDIANGSEKLGGPVVISGAKPRPGQTDLVFDPLHQLNRPGLLLSNGTVYVAYGSHCDRPRYDGWIFAYDAATLRKKGVFVTAPDYGKAGIWMSGAGPAADSNGSIFVATGDGLFDAEKTPARDLANSIIKIALNNAERKFTLLDYFTPFNQARLSRHDGDLGSGGVLLLPDQPGSHPHLLVEIGKEGTVYLVDRDAMAAKNLHYCATCAYDRQIVQELYQAIAGGVWGMPAYWNNTLYVSGSHDILRAFAFKNGLLVPTPASVSRDICRYPGCGLAISANSVNDGVLWALEAGSYDSRKSAILRAYEAANLDHLLYSSEQQAERDDPGGAVKFTVPTVIHGKVYVGAAGQLSVFGLHDPNQR